MTLFRPISAREAGLVGCPACGRVSSLGRARCPRCGAALSDHRAHSTQATWAFLAAGILAYIPANTEPMLITSTLGQREENTIVGGAVELVASGAYFVAAVVFVASVVIPILKFVAVAYLARSIDRGSAKRLHEKRHLHHVVELIGRWSMIDVFVVAVLGALVQLGALASIDPGPAAAPFAISVIFTMLAAQSLDARAIWNPRAPSGAKGRSRP